MLPGTQAWSRARTKALFDDEQAFIAPGLQTIALLSELAIERGRGATLTDVDGRTYLDLNAGVSVASLGHSHPRYVAALTAQLEKVTVGSFTSRPRAELVRLIAELAPGNLKRTQFFSGGAEAVEAAIRLARSYTKRTDVIVASTGDLTLIDLNDWPSFAPCREAAADAIADYLARRVHAAWNPGLVSSANQSAL